MTCHNVRVTLQAKFILFWFLDLTNNFFLVLRVYVSIKLFLS